MLPSPSVVLDRPVCKPKLSLILLDWGVRESFHSLHYLNRQTVPRHEYEVLWLEFYDQRPAGLNALIAERPELLDRWIVAGYPRELIYHKHRLYNLGLVASRGEVCVICDSDAIYTPTFIENVIRAFEEDPEGFFHLDQVRNNNEKYYPFNYPTVEELLAEDCNNWLGHGTKGVLSDYDRIHTANYGACLAARRRDLLAIGGADEHLDYLGYMCGPYDLTFRLVHHQGRYERWLTNEYLFHTWHPNASGNNHDYHGPHDGGAMSLRALDAMARYRVPPSEPSPLLARGVGSLEAALQVLATRPEPRWHSASPPAYPDTVYLVSQDYLGFRVFCHHGWWYGLRPEDGELDVEKANRGGYPVMFKAQGQRELEWRIGASPHAVYDPPGRLARLMRSLRTQPLVRLPFRLLRKARRVAAGIRKPRVPWQPIFVGTR